jgi:hypothetical protein
MKTALATLVTLLAVFALSACGGGNNSTGSSSGDSSNSSGEAPKEMTAAEKRQAVANKMKDAFVALDADAIKPLFPEEEQGDLESHILKDLRKMKADGDKVTAETPEITEKEGKFYATFKQTVEHKDGKKEDDAPKLQVIEKEGKYYLSFKR